MCIDVVPKTFGVQLHAACAWFFWGIYVPGVLAGPVANLGLPDPKQSEKNGAVVVKITETTYQCGRVRMDSESRTLRFAAEVNGEEGPLEYALVTHSGAKHESLLVTDVDPVEIHTAALLLGASASPGGGNSSPVPPAAGPLNAESLRTAVAPSGKKIEIWVQYQKGEKTFRNRLESCLEWRDGMNSGKKRGVPPTAWLYTGSYVFEGSFAAKEEGNLFALVISNEALVNIPLPQNRDDQTWFSRGELMPPRGTPVALEVKFLP